MASVFGSALQEAQRGGADGDDAVAAGTNGIESGGRRGRDITDLLVHLVLGGIIRLDRQEGAGAHMQGDKVALDAGGVEFGKEVGREMQAGGRGGHGAFLAGVNGLVVGAILLVLRALGGDVGRKRDVADVAIA